MKKVKDDRLHAWPPVKTDGERFIIEGKLLTPFRMLLWQEFVYEPLRTFWKLATLAAVLDWLFEWWRHFSFIQFYLHTGRSSVLWGLLVAWLLLLVELHWRFPLLRFLLGRKVKLIFREDGGGVPGWFRDRVYSHELGITFAALALEGAEHPVYRQSRKIVLILADRKIAWGTECFDVRLAGQFAANCNTLLTISQERLERVAMRR